MSDQNADFIKPNADGSPTRLAMPVDPYVKKGSVVGTVMEELHMLYSELGARREFDMDVAAFLNEQGLAAAFEAYRKAKPHT